MPTLLPKTIHTHTTPTNTPSHQHPQPPLPPTNPNNAVAPFKYIVAIQAVKNATIFALF